MIVGPLLTASMIRLSDSSVLIPDKIQRWERRSYSTPGSVGSLPFLTGAQKAESEMFEPIWFPCLSKILRTPFTKTSTWLGPTAPIESGGMNPDSLLWAPRKLVDGLTACFGPIAALPAR